MVSHIHTKNLTVSKIKVTKVKKNKLVMTSYAMNIKSKFKVSFIIKRTLVAGMFQLEIKNPRVYKMTVKCSNF